jgi:hypothetical protein
MLFLVDQFTRELQGRADVRDGQVVLPLHLFEGHAAGQAADHDRHGCAGAANDGLAVADCRIDGDAVVHGVIRVRRAYRIGKKSPMQSLQVTLERG